MGRVVVNRLGGHRADDAEFVHHRTDVREKLANFRAGLSKPSELELRAVAQQLFALQLRQLFAAGHAFGHRLAVHLREFGLGIERFQMRRPSRHREPDDAPDLRRVMRGVHHARPPVFLRRRGGRGAEEGGIDERRERQRADALGPAPEKSPAV